MRRGSPYSAPRDSKRRSRLGQILTISGLLLLVGFLLSATPALAQVGRPDDFGLSFGNILGLGSGDIRVIALSIVNVLLGFLGVLLVILILYGGYVYMTSGGNPDKIEEAKKILRNAIIGVIIILLSFAITRFLLNSLARGISGLEDPSGGVVACTNCGHLGAGIIESVYPEPGAREVVRNTSIIVTFKEEMNPATIINFGTTLNTIPAPDVNGFIGGTLEKVGISYIDPVTDTIEFIDPLEVRVSTINDDRKTYVFVPQQYLGDGVNDIWHEVTLSGDIQKANGDPAFGTFGDGYSWTFEVGTRIDLEPPRLLNIFPIPDGTDDNYVEQAADLARGLVQVVGQPSTGIDLEVSAAVPDSGSVPATVSGQYTGTFSGTISVDVDAAVPGEELTATVIWGTGGNINDSSKKLIEGGRIVLGSGLALTPDTVNAVDGWTVTVQAPESADTLTIGNRTYSFTDVDPPGPNQILVGGGPNTTAFNIFLKLGQDRDLVDIFVGIQGSTGVELNAKLAGSAGNTILVTATGSWADITPLSGGQDQSFTITCQGPCDQPRNVIIQMEFSEAMNPLTTIGEVATDDNSQPGVGNLGADDFSFITVQADVDGNGFDDDEYVAGEFILSNQYRTVEFTTGDVCLDATGQPLRNSCGDPVFCLPISETALGGVTSYKVTVLANELATCGSGANEVNCSEARFPTCGATNTGSGNVCQDPTNPGVLVYSPQSVSRTTGLLTGVEDMAANSFDGNRDNNTWGPSAQSGFPPFSFNDLVDQNGDDAEWQFYINDRIELTPPKININQTGVRGRAVSQVAPIELEFDSLLQSSSLKPNGGYRDGYCTCGANGDCGDGEICSPNGFCQSPTGITNFCQLSSECAASQVCQTRDHLTLFDQTVPRSGYWIANRGLDRDSPQDGWADRTRTEIRHTALKETTVYAAEAASGIKDVYQNCYLPGEGPTDVDIGNGACGTSSGTSSAKPYCCNGVATNQVCRDQLGL